MSEVTTNSVSRFIQIVIATVPIFTAYLFLMGTSYFQGYLDGYGIEDSPFLLPSDRAILYGFLSATTLSFKPLIVLSLCALLAAVVALFERSIKAKLKSLASLSRINLTKAIPDGKHETDLKTQRTIESWAISSMVAMFLAVISVVFLVASYFSLLSGRDQAKVEIRQFNSGQANHVLIHLKAQENPLLGRQVVCNSTQCVFWLGNRSVVLPISDIEYTSNYSRHHVVEAK